MRYVATLAVAAIGALLSWPALAEGEASATDTAPQQSLSQGELDALVAPIALYPDALLAQVLMASTYPLEIVQADRWAKANKSLKGDKLDEALAKQDWDGSIKALVATPTVLAMMNDDLDWTEKARRCGAGRNRPYVMDAIQRLRAKAEANGKLKTTKEQKVTVTKEADQEVIVIEPTSPETVYVPYYEPCGGLWQLGSIQTILPITSHRRQAGVGGCHRDRHRLGGAGSPSATPSGTASIGTITTSTSTSTRT
jgi:hypothetical protein